jgi:hypothetical protein
VTSTGAWVSFTKVIGAILLTTTLGFVASAAAAGLPKLPRYIGKPRGSDMRVKPDLIFWTGDGSGFFAANGHRSRRPFRIHRIHWSDWTETAAVGTGANWLDNCKPDCAEGTYTPYRVRLKAFRPRSRSGYLVFTRMRVRYSHHIPQGIRHRTETWVLVDNRGDFNWSIPAQVRRIGRATSASHLDITREVGTSRLHTNRGASRGRRYCGTFRARGYTLYAYVLRGQVGCKRAKPVLKAWFIDANHTQQYGRWFCADSHGQALSRGQVEHCSRHDGAYIADYDHRL